MTMRSCIVFKIMSPQNVDQMNQGVLRASSEIGPGIKWDSL
jgi:hypothetical protein